MLSQIKHYLILREIGGGGFAKVYLAQDENLKREVAIKVLHANLAEDSDFRRFFEREAHLVASLEHLAVVPIYDFGEMNGQLFLVMRYMRGGTLSDRLEKLKRALTIQELITLLERLAPTFDAIHQKGVIHRDLKPSNILYDEAGSAYIADFGIARVQQATTRLTQTGLSFGTPQYSSPEQITGEGILDQRSDIYTLGVIVYELLTGEYPYWADTPLGWVYKHLESPIPNVRDINRRLPEGLQGIIEGMMAKARNDRYSSVQSVLADLKRIEGGQPIHFQVNRSKKPTRTIPIANSNRLQEQNGIGNRNMMIGAVVAMVFVGLILGWVFLQNSSGNRGIMLGETTPTVSSSNEIVAVSANVTPIENAISTKIPTIVATMPKVVPTIPIVFPTSTSLLAPTATSINISTSTSTPTPIETVTATTPTSVPPTNIPTRTRTAVPTATRVNTIAVPSTNTPLATQAVILAINLLEPGNNASFSLGDTITFRWQGGTLQGTQYYDVRVWREGAPHLGVVGSQTTQASVNTNALGNGTFYWSIAVVDNGGSTTIVSEPQPYRFTVNETSNENEEGSGDDPATPIPDPTFPAPEPTLEPAPEPTIVPTEPPPPI